MLCAAGVLAVLAGVFAPVQPVAARRAGLGVDVDFYTGPISSTVWLRMRRAGVALVVAQAWGGRSRNEFASAQLSGARSIGRMKQAAYVLLNYDDKVCPTFANPVRDGTGACAGDLVAQETPGARWQVRQGLAALGSERAHVAFVAIDVEWFVRAAPPADEESQSDRRQHILDAIDEVRKAGKKPVVYTRNAKRHWQDITGCGTNSPRAGCQTLYALMNDPSSPIPLWDVEHGAAHLEHFQPYGAWTGRVGRQYELDRNAFGLPSSRTVDLDVFDLSFF
jgi:hypothetical protein